MIDTALPCNCSRSKRAIWALVSLIEAFCGRFQSMISSSRSDEGKNCCCTKLHAEQGKQEGRHRHRDCHPAIVHADEQHARERSCEAPLCPC